MKIIETSRPLLPEEKYNLTMSPEIMKMSNLVSQRIEIAAWCKYEDKNSKGEDQVIFSILTPESEVYATNSATFMNDFERMSEMLEADGVEVKAIKVISGTSKSGREFITCAYAG